MTHVLVTGATGFIGHHLVKHLADQGTKVTCLVRPSSDRSRLDAFAPRYVLGDVTDRDSIALALKDIDVVYHLAGLTKSLCAADLKRVNEEGVRNVAACCAEMERPPVLVVASSLAAAGPASKETARLETDPASPVSMYGRSKRAGELAAKQYASQVPITIVRPPIVLGEGDRDGFTLFETIANWGIHLVPSLSDEKYSLVHADDLVAAFVLAATRGRRINADEDDAEGIYFAAADEMLTYAQLGRMIGEVLGRPRAWIVHTPQPLVWATAAFSEIVSRLRGRPNIVNLDKAREAAAGSWTCSTDALRRDTGFEPALPLRDRLEQTARWYIAQGWLQKPRRMA